MGLNLRWLQCSRQAPGDLRQPIGPEEGLAVDFHPRRAADARSDGGVVGFSEPAPTQIALCCRCCLFAGHAVARGDFSERCHVRNVHTALEIGREYIPSEGACMSVAKFFKRVEHTRGAVRG